MSDRFYNSAPTSDDKVFDAALRPKVFDEFVGQRQVLENVRIYLQAAKARGDVLEHILLSGLPGLGKTTLAGIIARELETEMHSTTGPAIDKPGDLAGLLTNLKEGDVLFIDEIHRLSAVTEEYLYGAMEDFSINIVLDSGPSARTLTIDVPRFTLIGATTREGLLTAPFRSRFGVRERLTLYPPEDLEKIIRRSASILNVELEDDAAVMLSRRARGTPRIANRILRRVRDVAQVKGDGTVTTAFAEQGLKMLGVDECGLEELDRKILEFIISHGGGPVGLKTIAVSVGEEGDTIEEVYEPYLIQQGYLVKTPQGRKVSEKAWKHMGKEMPRPGGLF